MWSVLKKKMTKSAGYEMSDRESDSGDDCVVVLKKYTKIPSFAEGLSQEATTTTAIIRYENPYEIDATPPTDPNEASTSVGGSDQTILLLATTQEDQAVVDNQMDADTARTSRDIENNNHEDEAGFGARYERNEDENANGGIHVVSRTLSDLRLAEGAALRGARLSPPRMKRREKQVPGGVASSHEMARPQRVPRAERVSQAEVSYENLHYDPRRRKKDHAPPPPPPPPQLPRDFLSSNSEDEMMRSRSNSRLPRDFPAGNRLYDLPATNDHTRETVMNCPVFPGTIESGYLTLEDVRAQLEQARALNRFPEEIDGRSNDSRYDGGSEITSEAEGRDSDPVSVGVKASRFTGVSASTVATKNQQRINRKSLTHELPDAEEAMKREDMDEKVLESVGNSTQALTGDLEKLQPVLKSSASKVVDAYQDGIQSIEGGPSSGGSTLSAPETDDRDRKKQDMRTLNFRRSSQETMISGENDPMEAAGSSDMRVEGLPAQDESEALDIPSVCEPTHMSWDELMQEAQILGIPLYRPAASLCRSDSDRRSSMSSSATSSDLSHASPLQSPKMTRLTGSGPWHRKDNSQKRAKEKSEKKNSPFKGKFKLQNLFAAKKAQTASPKKKSDREPAQNIRDSNDKEGKLDPIPFRASRLREFVRSGLESPVLQHYRSGPPSLRSDRGQNLVTELTENGFRNSSISLRSHVLSSSYSSGSLGSVFSRSSSQTPSSSTSYGKTSASVESPGSSTGTSGSAAILHASGLSSPPVVVQQSVTVPGAADNWFYHLPSAANLSSSGNTDFMIGLRQLRICGWYWGPLGWEEAGMKLTNLSDGSFLVRDSSDDRYILSLSFRSQGLTHHTRIEHYKVFLAHSLWKCAPSRLLLRSDPNSTPAEQNCLMPLAYITASIGGVFSFYSQPRSHAASNIVDFIEKAMEQSRSNQYLYFLRPRVAGLPPVPVQLLYPVSRFVEVPSLKHICRVIISSLVPRRDLVDQLPLTSSLRRYVKEESN